MLSAVGITEYFLPKCHLILNTGFQRRILSVERRLKGDMEEAPIQVDIGNIGESWMCEQR